MSITLEQLSVKLVKKYMGIVITTDRTAACSLRMRGSHV